MQVIKYKCLLDHKTHDPTVQILVATVFKSLRPIPYSVQESRLKHPATYSSYEALTCVHPMESPTSLDIWCHFHNLVLAALLFKKKAEGIFQSIFRAASLPFVRSRVVGIQFNFFKSTRKHILGSSWISKIGGLDGDNNFCLQK